jgi:hypothetical protein
MPSSLSSLATIIFLVTGHSEAQQLDPVNPLQTFDNFQSGTTSQIGRSLDPLLDQHLACLNTNIRQRGLLGERRDFIKAVLLGYLRASCRDEGDPIRQAMVQGSRHDALRHHITSVYVT